MESPSRRSALLLWLCASAIALAAIAWLLLHTQALDRDNRPTDRTGGLGSSTLPTTSGTDPDAGRTTSNGHQDSIPEWGKPDRDGLWPFGGNVRFSGDLEPWGIRLEPLLWEFSAPGDLPQGPSAPHVGGLFKIPPSLCDPLYWRVWIDIRETRSLVGKRLSSVPWQQGLTFRAFAHVAEWKFREISPTDMRIEIAGVSVHRPGLNVDQSTISLEQKERLVALIVVHGLKKRLLAGELVALQGYADEEVLSHGVGRTKSRSTPVLVKLNPIEDEHVELLRSKQERAVLETTKDHDGLIRYYESALSKWKHSIDAHCQLARLYAEEKRYVAAANLMWNAMRLVQEDKATQPDPLTGERLTDAAACEKHLHYLWKMYDDLGAGRTPTQNEDEPQEEDEPGR